jgi:hypothetical protein
MRVSPKSDSTLITALNDRKHIKYQKGGPEIGHLEELPNDRFGYLAVLFDKFSLTAAFEDKAAIKSAGNHDFKGPLSANTGRPAFLAIS